MQLAIITDTHYGARSDSAIFAAYFRKFYSQVFFPTIDRLGITHVLHLGDLVDRRKYINFVTANNLHNDFIKPLLDRNIPLTIIPGNHDVPYKNSNEINAISELYSDNVGIDIIVHPEHRTIGDLQMLFLPWINSENYDRTMQMINETSAQVIMSHLELSGFSMYKNQVATHDMDPKIFDKFDVVCSGHYHTRSTNGNIFYLGAPYEMTWADYNDARGFHIFDTETRNLEFIRNPFAIYKKYLYDDSVDDMHVTDLMKSDYSDFKDTYVKLIVRNKTNPYMYDTLVDLIENAGVINITAVEDHMNRDAEPEEEIVDQAEDTMTILRKHIDGLNISNKEQVASYFQKLYNEALEIE